MFTPLDTFVNTYKVQVSSKCRTSSIDYTQSIIDDIQDELNQLLPHGAGIDQNWVIEHSGSTEYMCYNSYHAMDGNGHYCGWVDFEVTIDVSTMEFSVCIDKKQAKEIEDEYVSPDQDEDIGSCFDYCAAPYLGDLDEIIHQDVKFAIHDYFLVNTLKYAKKDCPAVFKRIAEESA